MKNKIIITFLLGCLCLLSFTRLTLVKQKDRDVHTISLPKSLQEEINLQTSTLSDVEIIDYAVNKTAQLFDYSFTESINLNGISKAHCVTYSKLCATICNIAFNNNNINSKAKCVVGYVTWGKINLCNIGAKLCRKYSNYLMNHDFVEINGSDYTIFVDPTAYDLINTDLKLIEKH